MIFTTRPIPRPPSIKINGKELNVVNSHKLLGVIVDKDLKFREHITFISQKVAKSLGIIYRLRDYVPVPVLQRLYFSFIYPYLNYCIIIWGSTYPSHLEPLFRLQKRAVRLIGNVGYFDHTAPIFKELKIMKLLDIYKYNLMLYFFKSKICINLLPNHSHNTRYNGNLHPPYHRLTISQHSIAYQGFAFWNQLPVLVRNSLSYQSFKFKAKSHILSSY